MKVLGTVYGLHSSSVLLVGGMGDVIELKRWRQATWLVYVHFECTSVLFILLLLLRSLRERRSYVVFAWADGLFSYFGVCGNAEVVSTVFG
jgi:hypothetical protein